MSVEIPNLSALSIHGIPFMLLTSYMITWNWFHQPSLELVNQIELTYARTQGSDYFDKRSGTKYIDLYS